ncbi:beta-lactamase family protein [Chloroflexi bacterium TSY]|nr:beta-lactamase family protein [Chloroflexi bacterium TSY]
MIDESKIEDRILNAIDSGDILSAALTIVQGDEIVYANGFGETSVENPALPVSAETLHLIGLTSRTITTAMIFRLIEQGVLELEKPIADYLPGYVFHNNPDYGRRLTLRHLLSETSGLASGGRGWGPNHPDELRRFVWEEFSYFEFNTAPGLVPDHGNNPILAAHVAEAATGRYFAQLVQELVLDPLDMDRTFYDRSVAMTYPLALPHERDDDGNLQVIHRYPDNMIGNADFYAVSTANDLANLASMLLNEGRFRDDQFLSSESVRTILTRYADYQVGAASSLRDRMEEGEALGLITGTYKGLRCFGRPAAVHGMSVAFDLFPEQELGVVCLTNLGRWPQHDMLFDIYDQLLDLPSDFQYPAPPGPSDTDYMDLWDQHSGDYLANWGELVSIRVQGGELTLEAEGEVHSLIPVNGEEYYIQDEESEREPLIFITDQSVDNVGDQAPTPLFMFYNTPHVRIERDPAFVPDPEAWRQFEGIYVNYHGIAGLDGFRIYLEEGVLYAVGPDSHGRLDLASRDGVPCTPLNPTRFLSEHGRFDFVNDEESNRWLLIRDGAFRYKFRDGSKWVENASRRERT